MRQVKTFDNDKQANDWLEAYKFDVEVKEVKFSITESRNAILVVYERLPLPFEPTKEELYGQEADCLTH